mmetsp:Transcript_10762/g.29974  ORF Transcript_10762/g.29974 Transcript_10762/m.29974 type:complete len:233 (+) Transcript_10762:1477-2175(+)
MTVHFLQSCLDKRRSPELCWWDRAKKERPSRQACLFVSVALLVLGRTKQQPAEREDIVRIRRLDEIYDGGTDDKVTVVITLFDLGGENLLSVAPRLVKDRVSVPQHPRHQSRRCHSTTPLVALAPSYTIVQRVGQCGRILLQVILVVTPQPETRTQRRKGAQPRRSIGRAHALNGHHQIILIFCSVVQATVLRSTFTCEGERRDAVGLRQFEISSRDPTLRQRKRTLSHIKW